jgi:hypothetical protein
VLNSSLEVGARGLVGGSTFRAFKSIGFLPSESSALCKTLSAVVARCSYAIYLAHTNSQWTHNTDLVLERNMTILPTPTPEPTTPKVAHIPSLTSLAQNTPNITVLRREKILHLFHFTDSGNLPSIRKVGLMSANHLAKESVTAILNSDPLSRKLDARAGLEKYVRLSFCSKNPMMYVAKKEGRISHPVLLKIKLEVVSRPGVLFSDCNALRSGAVISQRPDHIHFDIVKMENAFAVPEHLRHFFQAEILVPSPIPPHLIIFPNCTSPPIASPPKFILPRDSPPMLVEESPPPTFCEFPVGPQATACSSCVPGLLICPDHLVPCGGESLLTCCFCQRVLCSKHEDCFCAESHARRLEVAALDI